MNTSIIHLYSTVGTMKTTSVEEEIEKNKWRNDIPSCRKYKIELQMLKTKHRKWRTSLSLKCWNPIERRIKENENLEDPKNDKEEKWALFPSFYRERGAPLELNAITLFLRKKGTWINAPEFTSHCRDWNYAPIEQLGRSLLIITFIFS